MRCKSASVAELVRLCGRLKLSLSKTNKDETHRNEEMTAIGSVPAMTTRSKGKGIGEMEKERKRGRVGDFPEEI